MLQTHNTLSVNNVNKKFSSIPIDNLAKLTGFTKRKPKKIHH